MEGAIIPAKCNAYGRADSPRPDYAAGDIYRNGDARAQGAFRRTPAIMVSVLQTPPQFLPAMHREPVQAAPAGLPAEDGEVNAGRRLAARFVRPAEDTAQAAPRRSMPRFKPFLAAGVLFLAAACASAVYLVKSGALTPVVSAYASTAQEDGEPAQAPAAGESWAGALETFKALARSQAAPEDKAE